MIARAFCPGHISGLFQVRRHEDVMRTGTRGAGVCVSAGATSTVTLEPGDGAIEVAIDRVGSSAPVTRDVIASVVGDSWDVVVETTLDMPMGQGLATSASGAVSAGLAAASLLGVDKRVVMEAAHRAEITNGSGMGDVAGIVCGGASVRLREGMPPGCRRVADEGTITVAIVDGPVRTADVLGDVDVMRRLDEAADDCVRDLGSVVDLGSLLSLSRRFTESSGLAPRGVAEAMSAVPGASMVMLGGSVFCVGDRRDDLEPYGDTRLVHVDPGPRVTP